LEVVRGREVLEVDVPASGVVLEETSSRTVPAQLSFSAPLSWVATHPLSALSNFGQRVHATQILRIDDQATVEVELGWYKVDDWVEQDSGVQVTALDLLSIPDENDLVWPSSPPAGATILSELRRMAQPLPVVLDDPIDQEVPRTTQWGVKRVENIRDLCASYGLEYGVQPDGYVHVWATRDGRRPVAHYSARDAGTPGSRPGRLLSAPRKAPPRRANRVTVVGTTGSGDDEQRWSTTVTATAPPFDEAGYGIVTERYEMNQATSQHQVDEAAQTYLRDALVTTETRSWEIPADPRLQRGDIISATTETGETLVGRIIAYSLPVSEPGEKERVDVEVIAW
jgi:hypothetical protein